MIDRRHILGGAIVVGAGAATTPELSIAAAMSYQAAVETTWRPLRAVPPGAMASRELVRFGSLAANCHNSQPWLFSVSDPRIGIGPDFSRRCPAVDPDGHRVFASLGCTAENIVQAVGAMGLLATCGLAGDTVEIDLEPELSIRSALAEESLAGKARAPGAMANQYRRKRSGCSKQPVANLVFRS